MYAVPPEKKPIHPDQPLVNQSLNYSLDMFVNQQQPQGAKPEIGESPVSKSRDAVPPAPVREEGWQPVKRSPVSQRKPITFPEESESPPRELEAVN